MPYGINHGFPAYGQGESYASIGLACVRAGCCGSLPCPPGLQVGTVAVGALPAVVTQPGFPVGAAVGAALGLAVGLLFTAVDSGGE